MPRHRLDLADLKSALREGPYAWPGGYPLYFVGGGGAAYSFKAIRDNWRDICRDHVAGAVTFGGISDIAGIEVNWEDPDLVCEHTGERIESAYRN